MELNYFYYAVIVFNLFLLPFSVKSFYTLVVKYFNKKRDNEENEIEVLVSPLDTSCKIKVIKTVSEGGFIRTYDIEVVESDTIFGFPQSVRKE